jgi:flagellar capping protein FliD
MGELKPVEDLITPRIYMLRGQKIIFDFDLAQLYGIETKMLKRAVKRNLDRFPEDFMFELTPEEFADLRHQFGTSTWGGTRYMPFAFTEHGVVMLSSVLNTTVAINASIKVVRAFIKLRNLAGAYEALSTRLDTLETQYDSKFDAVFNAIEGLTTRKKEPRTRIGFKKE